jgi:uncharacterized delta-60 repeat protein
MLPSRRLLVSLMLIGFVACGGESGDQARPSAGTLDHKFGTRGEVTTDFGHYALLWALDEAPDGRIVAAGRTFAERADERFALARYRADGRLDETFGTRGLVETSVGRETVAAAVDARDDGTTIVLGTSRDTLEPANLTLARYDDRGRLDPGFGADGIVVTDAPDVGFSPIGFLPTTDGTILVGGSYAVSQHVGIFFARYLADGRLDPSFGVGGTALVDTGTIANANAAAIARRADGTLTAAHIVHGESRLQLVFLRLTPDGAVDTSFGTRGRVAVDRDDFFGEVVGFLPDGGVVTSTYEVDDTTHLQRYRGDGTLDTGFASPVIPGSSNAMTTDADGNIIITLDSFISNVAVLARVLPTGELDSTFGDAGTVTNEGPSAWNAVIVPRTGGGILTGGWLSGPGVHHLEFVLRRYHD